MKADGSDESPAEKLVKRLLWDLAPPGHEPSDKAWARVFTPDVRVIAAAVASLKALRHQQWRRAAYEHCMEARAGRCDRVDREKGEGRDMAERRQTEPVATTHVIYGTSDDLIEVEGPCGDEFGGGREERFVALSTGDVFAVHYSDRGVWRVRHHVVTDALMVEIDAMPADADSDGYRYTDRATITGDVTGAEVWKSWPPTVRELRDWLADGVLDRASDAQIQAVRDVLRGSDQVQRAAALDAAQSGLRYETAERGRPVTELREFVASAMRADCACFGQEPRCACCAAYDRLRSAT